MGQSWRPRSSAARLRSRSRTSSSQLRRSHSRSTSRTSSSRSAASTSSSVRSTRGTYWEPPVHVRFTNEVGEGLGGRGSRRSPPTSLDPALPVERQAIDAAATRRPSRWGKLEWGGYPSPFRSNQRPGVAAAGVVDGEAGTPHDRPGPADQGLSLAVVEQRLECRGGALVGQPGEAGEQPIGDGLAAEVPDHRAQLVVAVKGEPVVDRPQPAVVAGQAVPTLAVGGVGDQVEAAHRAQPGVSALVLDEREVVGLDVERHEPLQRPRAEGQRVVVAQDRLGHDPPPQPLGELVGGDLAPVEPAGEVPQRPLAPAGLLDRAGAVAVRADLDEQRGVRAPGHAPQHLDLSRLQQLERLWGAAAGRRGQFIRGHTWPSGSIGRPQKPQSGRPWATRSSANCANAAAWGSVKQNRAVAGWASSAAVLASSVVSSVGSPVTTSSRTTTIRSSGSSYLTPIEPTSHWNGRGVTSPWPSAGSTSGDRSSRSASRYSPSAATCCFSQRR